MDLALSLAAQAALQAAARASRPVRHWRRYQAVLLLGSGQSVAQVARTLTCSEQSVRNWLLRYQQGGVAARREGTHRGPAFRLGVVGDAALETLLMSSPSDHGYHATGWTVALLIPALAARGWLLSPTTLRRTLHRLGWRWKRPKYVLGRPDPDYEKKTGRANSGASDVDSSGRGLGRG